MFASLALSNTAVSAQEVTVEKMEQTFCRIEARSVSQSVDVTATSIRYASAFKFFTNPLHFAGGLCQRELVTMVYRGDLNLKTMEVTETYSGDPPHVAAKAARRGKCASVFPPFHPNEKCGSWTFLQNVPDKNGATVPLDPWFVFTGIAGGDDVKKSLVGLYDQKMNEVGKSLSNVAKKECKSSVEVNSVQAAITQDSSQWTYAITYKVHDRAFADSGRQDCKETNVRELTYGGRMKVGSTEVTETYSDSLGGSAERSGKCAGGLYPPFHPKAKCSAWSFVKQKANSKGVSQPLDPWFDVSSFANGQDARTSLIVAYDKMLAKELSSLGNLTKKK